MDVRNLLNWFEEEFTIATLPPLPPALSRHNGGVGVGRGGNDAADSAVVTPTKPQQPKPTTADTPITLDDSDSDTADGGSPSGGAAVTAASPKGHSEQEPITLDSDSFEDEATAPTREVGEKEREKRKGKGKKARTRTTICHESTSSGGGGGGGGSVHVSGGGGGGGAEPEFEEDMYHELYVTTPMHFGFW